MEPNLQFNLLLFYQTGYTQSLLETPIRVYLASPVLYANLFLPKLMELPYWERKFTYKLSPPRKGTYFIIDFM